MGSMLIDDLLTSGGSPALEWTMRFAAQRQVLLAHQIANLHTPGFQMVDASVDGFRGALREAIEERRRRTGGMHGELDFEGSREIMIGADGSISLDPGTPVGGVLHQDRNARDLERLMQAQAENVGAFRVASDLLTQHHRLIKDALAERV